MADIVSLLEFNDSRLLRLLLNLSERDRNAEALALLRTLENRALIRHNPNVFCAVVSQVMWYGNVALMSEIVLDPIFAEFGSFPHPWNNYDTILDMAVCRGMRDMIKLLLSCPTINLTHLVLNRISQPQYLTMQQLGELRDEVLLMPEYHDRVAEHKNNGQLHLIGQ